VAVFYRDVITRNRSGNEGACTRKSEEEEGVEAVVLSFFFSFFFF